MIFNVPKLVLLWIITHLTVKRFSQHWWLLKTVTESNSSNTSVKILSFLSIVHTIQVPYTTWLLCCGSCEHRPVTRKVIATCLPSFSQDYQSITALLQEAFLKCLLYCIYSLSLPLWCVDTCAYTQNYTWRKISYMYSLGQNKLLSTYLCVLIKIYITYFFTYWHSHIIKLLDLWLTY